MDGHLGGFHLLTVANIAAVNTGVPYIWVPVFISEGIYPEVEILDHIAFLFLIEIVIYSMCIYVYVCVYMYISFLYYFPL